MSRKGQPPKPSPSGGIDPLLASWPWAWVVLFFCVVLALLSLVGVFVQANRPGGAVAVVDYLLRAAIGAALASCIGRYLRALSRAKPDDRTDVHRAIATWWMAVGVSLLVYAVYFLWAASTRPGVADSLR